MIYIRGVFWHDKCNKKFTFTQIKSCIFDKYQKCGWNRSFFLSCAHFYFYDILPNFTCITSTVMTSAWCAGNHWFYSAETTIPLIIFTLWRICRIIAHTISQKYIQKTDFFRPIIGRVHTYTSWAIGSLDVGPTTVPIIKITLWMVGFIVTEVITLWTNKTLTDFKHVILKHM